MNLFEYINGIYWIISHKDRTRDDIYFIDYKNYLNDYLFSSKLLENLTKIVTDYDKRSSPMSQEFTSVKVYVNYILGIFSLVRKNNIQAIIYFDNILNIPLSNKHSEKFFKLPSDFIYRVHILRARANINDKAYEDGMYDLTLAGSLNDNFYCRVNLMYLFFVQKQYQNALDCISNFKPHIKIQKSTIKNIKDILSHKLMSM